MIFQLAGTPTVPNVRVMELTGKHALITGGGSGIGAAIALALAEAGAEVTITGRRKSALKEIAAKSPRIFGQVMDVGLEESVTAGFAQAVEARGPIAICVANAGIAEGRALHKTSLETWRETMSTNLDGAFLTIREGLKTMRGLEWGRVIAVSSIAGVKGLKGAPAYSASKHGMIGLIRGLAADYSGTGLTFNALCPAYVDTDIITRNVSSISQRAGVSEEKALDIMVALNPHRRLIAPSEIAASALYLCAKGSESVNGQALQIAGGEV